jgi:hypothetical protein
VNESERAEEQYAIADPQFGTSLTRYPYQSALLGFSKDIEKRIFQIAEASTLRQRSRRRQGTDCQNDSDRDTYPK